MPTDVLFSAVFINLALASFWTREEQGVVSQGTAPNVPPWVRKDVA